MIPRPRQNRVTPFGNFEATLYRGGLMGNRGDLHGKDGTVVRSWRLKRWISCVLHDPCGGRVTFDTPGTYTPLFFLDETVALAAGHRPCAQCRPEAYRSFRLAWQSATGRSGTNVRAAEIDNELHRWRLDAAGVSPRWGNIFHLPDGVIISVPDQGLRTWLWSAGTIREWAHSGFGAPLEPVISSVIVVTPRPMVEVLRAGYRPLSGHNSDASMALTMQRAALAD